MLKMRSLHVDEMILLCDLKLIWLSGIYFMPYSLPINPKIRFSAVILQTRFL